MAFSNHIKKVIEDLRPQLPTTQSLLIPLLHEIQNEAGWISPEAMKEAAQYLDLPLAAVREVVTFYTMFKQKPLGKVHLQLCTNISCWLNGAEHLMECLEKKLGIKEGETTKDGAFTLSEVECLASCGTAPVLQVNQDYYENLNEKEVGTLIDKLGAQVKAGEKNIGKSTYQEGMWP